ncbi:C40 family peptidase [Olivibacter sitiensis]|uniref:C40 family peptidase n=1 Tax=Olivibacter sitiensis TaxID=376470 RepID=UPI001FE013BB|nr:C40 family peptidase [Olivibacter sitiensis]
MAPIWAQEIDTIAMKKLQEVIMPLKKQYAPDSREALLTLESTRDGRLVVETTEKEALPALERLLDSLSVSGIQAETNLLPDATLGDSLYGVVKLSVVNIRSKPANSAEMATQALLGAPLQLLKKQGGYYLVRTVDGYISWLDNAALQPMAIGAFDVWKNAPKVIVKTDYGHVYTETNEKATRVSDVVLGNVLRSMGKEKGYRKVLFPDGRGGYIKEEAVMDYNDWLKVAKLDADRIIEVGKTMLGVPYLWGGTSVKGVDCSGFTKTAYFMNGYMIPRDASQQVLVGEAIAILADDGELDTVKAMANLKKGDLLFFASGKNSNPSARVTHVAMYIGDGEFIHSAGQVRINSFLSSSPIYADFQTRTVVAARRYIGQEGKKGIHALKEVYYEQ